MSGAPGSFRISYIVPAHDEQAVLAGTARAIVQRLAAYPGSELILVENGSRDQTPALVATLAEELSGPDVTVRAAHSPPGTGRAVREGMRLATGDLLLLTGADLPFRFTDLDRFLVLDPRPKLVIGSKAHPDSEVSSPVARRVMSLGFRLLRQVALGIDVGDSQGTVLIEGPLARRILPSLRSDDYLITTELIAVAANLGVRAVEVPVNYLEPRGDSRVRPLHDSLSMARGLLSLRRRLRRQSGAAR
ncbi:MAG: glycosyltransferase [Actinomycetota bacterium]